MKAAKPGNWKTKPLPEKRAAICLNRTFSPEQMHRIMLGVIPDQMEDKWFIYWQDNKLFCHRSWTGTCVFIIYFEPEGKHFKMVRADVNRDPKEFDQTKLLPAGQSIDDADRKWIDGLINLVLRYDNDKKHGIHEHCTFHKSEKPRKIEKLTLKHREELVSWARRPDTKAILVRIGVDSAYGKWNAPTDPDSREFIYVPIPEKSGTQFHPRCERKFDELMPSLNDFAAARELDLVKDLKFPPSLSSASMHLDPDFEYLTYGDNGDKRAKEIRQLKEDDLLVFYEGLRPCRPCDHRLIYAIVGIFVVKEIVDCANIPEDRWHENAHTRKQKKGQSDIVVRAKPRLSGRLSQYISIGEFRDRAYRVRRELLDVWGGLSVKDGYIQRSARPPRFKNACRFFDWFIEQKPIVLPANNPAADEVGKPDNHKNDFELPGFFTNSFHSLSYIKDQ